MKKVRVVLPIIVPYFAELLPEQDTKYLKTRRILKKESLLLSLRKDKDFY
jgi:hypothetical protein